MPSQTHHQTEAIVYHPIGIIRSEHTVPENTPIQPVYAAGCRAVAEIFPEYAKGLDNLEGFSHIYLIYHFHRAEPARLTVTPFLTDESMGVFATRINCRPNAIGFSIVRLIERRDHTLLLEDVDILDQTPLLDIKPYVARFDRIDATRGGWQDKVDEKNAQQQGQRNFQPNSGKRDRDQAK